MAGRGTPAVVTLEESGASYTLHEYHHDPAAVSYGQEAAVAMGIDPARVFKTLVAEVDGQLTVAVVPVSGHLDLKALAAAVGGKRARLADQADATRSTGYVLGGISPLGQRTSLPTVIDESAVLYDTVFVSAGRRGLEIEVAPDVLTSLTSALMAPISAEAPRH